MRPFAADDLPCALVELDDEGRIRDANAVFVSWTGLSMEELAGRAFTSLRNRISALVGTSDGLVRLANVDGTSRAVVVGRGGLIRMTTDGFAWSAATSGTSVDLRSVDHGLAADVLTFGAECRLQCAPAADR